MSLTLPTPESGTVVVCETGDGLSQYLLDGRHRLLADEPAASGGADAGPDPYALLLMSLGACTSMTLRLYARRKQWPLERVCIRLRHTRNHARDCEDCSENIAGLDHVERIIEMDGALSSEQRDRLLAIANACPVHQSLSRAFDITTRLGAASSQSPNGVGGL